MWCVCGLLLLCSGVYCGVVLRFLGLLVLCNVVCCLCVGVVECGVSFFGGGWLLSCCVGVVCLLWHGMCLCIVTMYSSCVVWCVYCVCVGVCCVAWA